MAEKIFKNAAAKLLAQHAVKSEEKRRAEMPAVPKSIVTPVAELKRELPEMDPEQVDRGRMNVIPVTIPVAAPQKEPMQPNITQSNMISSLIKYIIVLLCALAGWAVVAVIGPVMSLGTGGNIVVGLGCGAVLGLIFTIDLKS